MVHYIRVCASHCRLADVFTPEAIANRGPNNLLVGSIQVGLVHMEKTAVHSSQSHDFRGFVCLSVMCVHSIHLHMEDQKLLVASESDLKWRCTTPPQANSN